MDRIVISALAPVDDAVEIVERKGLGHPDTICDALAEAFSRSLCREYRRCFGEILHHNVDKALLCGGRAEPAFGGGEVIEPINIYLAGRAISEVGDKRIPICDIAAESSQAWLRANLHALDAQQHVRIHTLVRPGSADLRTLFSRRDQSAVPLANDTSIGVGHAPLSRLERLVLAIEKHVNGRDRMGDRPAWGEDVKVIGIRCENDLQLTLACAMIGRHLAHIDDYVEEKIALAKLARELAAEHGFANCDVGVNTADSIESRAVYLTVTGTSAEAGDDGQVGRGNRVNGLITPGQPMSLEAAAGKNPITHVGKIYNVAAREIAEALTREFPEIVKAQCLMVGRIGTPVLQPAILQIRLSTREHHLVAELKQRVEEIAADRIARIPLLVDDFVAGRIDLF